MNLFQEVVKCKKYKIIGMAQNYPSALLKSRTTTPLIFQKALSSIVQGQEQIQLETTERVNYEIELGVLIGKQGKNIAKSEAEQFIQGYFLALDLTGSQIKEYRQQGKSFCLQKSFDNYLPLSKEFIDKKDLKDPHNLELILKINNEVRIQTNTSTMFYNIFEQIEFISKFMTLNEGDMILTGAPEPVSFLKDLDHVDAQMYYEGKSIAKVQTQVHIKQIQE